MTRLELLGKLVNVATTKQIDALVAAEKLEITDRMFECGRIFGQLLSDHNLTEEKAFSLFAVPAPPGKEFVLPPLDPGQTRVRPDTRCKDGFTMSVQASQHHYISPRKDGLSLGIYTELEVGYPTQEETLLMPYCENLNDPCFTVYGYVPVEVIKAIVAKHGGLK